VEKLKHEYDDLRGRFEQMARELRFSIEDELKIYSRLLDELTKQSTTNTTATKITAKQGSALSATAYTAISSTIKSSGIEDRDTSTLAQHKGS
ncbi:unnamed protein product, partial [Rotaria socialis]